MSTDENGDSADAPRWDAYSNYEAVSSQVTETIEKALNAYARVNSFHVEGVSIPPDLAVEARGRILTAALRLKPELEHDRGTVEKYDEILGRWEGSEGHLQRLRGTSLRQSDPDWLEELVQDIATAGWEIGYLQAGRVGEKERSVPDPDEEFARMFSDL